MKKGLSVAGWIAFGVFEFVLVLLAIIGFVGDIAALGIVCIFAAALFGVITYIKCTNPEALTQKAADQRRKDILSQTKQGQVKLDVEEKRSQGIVCCPKCGSTSLSANKKGFGIGKAVVGAAALGGIGLVAGNKGAKKVRITCLNCGYDWFAGEK